MMCRRFVFVLFVVAVAGCDSPLAMFTLDLPTIRKQEKQAGSTGKVVAINGSRMVVSFGDQEGTFNRDPAVGVSPRKIWREVEKGQVGKGDHVSVETTSGESIQFEVAEAGRETLAGENKEVRLDDIQLVSKLVTSPQVGDQIELAEFSYEQIQDVADILEAMFGTPDEPILPGGDTGLDEVINVNNLRMASGGVKSDQHGIQRGLFRRHCVHCHGITGDGKGPTAPYLNPYPRDYRMGVFKFKSTPKGVKPTHADLRRILVNGVAGTSMPSFALLKEVEIEALVDYVKYLSVRGEVERAMYTEMADELDVAERLLDDEDLAAGSEFLVDDVLATVVGHWKNAESQVTPIPARPDWDQQETLVSIKRGRELFYGSPWRTA